MNQSLQAQERSIRSVFVGNIPYDASEENLRNIFKAVGPVLSFRIVFDRETGKPKGYGFCEFKDQETATSAIRNLNGYDLGGRQLRVDSASNEKARDESDSGSQNTQNVDNPMQHQMQHLLTINQAPEPLIDAETQIMNTIRGMQPEMLFEVCKQMKGSLLINPNETTHLLMQNPQLCYALLQTLVAIKAVDQQESVKVLHKPLVQPVQLQQPIYTPQPMAGYQPTLFMGAPQPVPTVMPANNVPPPAPLVNLPASVPPNDPRLASWKPPDFEQNRT